jgi:SAM-dependent methyltransferase
LHRRSIVALTAASDERKPGCPLCDHLTVRVDDRFDEFLESLAGFHRTWIVHLGLELGLLESIRRAGPDGIGPDALAQSTGCAVDPIRAWTIAADAHGIVSFDGERVSIDDETAVVLLDEDRSEYLGGQLSHAVVASLDHDRMASVFRTGEPVAGRPDRYRTSIERLTRQDIAVFFSEALASVPDLVAQLAAGASVVDLHCGGGRWLIAMARRFPEIRLMGVEFEADSVARAQANVESAGLADRIEIVHAEIADVDRSVGAHDVAYFQYALHDLADPVVGLRAAWRSLHPGGRLLVLDWCAPTHLEEYRTEHGRLVSGIQLDELFQGTRLRTIEELGGLFSEAELPAPQVWDLPSGATFLVARREET